MAPIAVGLVLGILAAELACVAARAAGAGVALAAAAALVAGAGASILLARRLRGLSWSRSRVALFVVLGAICIVQTARSGAFALRPTDPSESVSPADDFLVHHNCFTAYHEAARLLPASPNVYDPVLYLAPRDKPAARPPWQGPKDPRRIIDGLFFVDTYEYPPPFLLVPRAAVALGADFLTGRALWFVLQAAVLILALLMVAWHLGGEAGGRFALLAPLVYLAPACQMALQMGNFQVGAIAACAIAMVMIARGGALAGGALLSFVTLTKLFPGVLFLVLAARRRWRALGLAVLCTAGWIGLAYLVLGRAPFDAFLGYQVPRLSSGEAFPHLRAPFVAAINHSLYGMALKLRLFGIELGSFESASLIGWVYTIVPCAAALILGRRVRSPQAETALSILALALATYRSPFLPQEYAAIGPVWLLAVLAAARPLAPGRAALLAVAWIGVQLFAPWNLVHDPRAASLIALAAQLFAAAVFIAAIRDLARRW